MSKVNPIGIIAALLGVKQGLDQRRRLRRLQDQQVKRYDAETAYQRKRDEDADTRRNNELAASAYGQQLGQHVSPTPEARQRQIDIATGRFQIPRVRSTSGYPAGALEVAEAEGLDLTAPHPQGYFAGLPDQGETVIQRQDRLTRETAQRAQDLENLRTKNDLLLKDKDAELKRELATLDPRRFKNENDYLWTGMQIFLKHKGNPAEFPQFVQGLRAARASLIPEGSGAPVGQPMAAEAGAPPQPAAAPALGLEGLRERLKGLSPQGGLRLPPGLSTPPLVPPTGGTPSLEALSSIFGKSFPEGTPAMDKGRLSTAQSEETLTRADRNISTADLNRARAADIPEAAKDRTRRTDSYASHNTTQDEVALARQALNEKEFKFEEWYKRAKLGIDKHRAESYRISRSTTAHPAAKDEARALYREWSSALTQISGLERKGFDFLAGRNKRPEIAGQIQEKLEELRGKADKLRARIGTGGPPAGAKERRVPPPEFRKMLEAEYRAFEQEHGSKPTQTEKQNLSKLLRGKLGIPASGVGGY